VLNRAVDIDRSEFAENQPGLRREGSEKISLSQHAIIQENCSEPLAGRLTLQGVVYKAAFDQTHTDQDFAEQATCGLIRSTIRVGVFGLSPA